MQSQGSERSTPAQVDAALSESSEITNPLERFHQNLPPWPYCSEDPRRFGVIRCQRESAIAFPHIGPNSRRRVAYIALDVDRVGAAFLAEDVGQPWPTLTVINPRTAHAHLLYELSDPLYPGRNEKADWLLAATREGLTRCLGADPRYRGALMQNPLSLRWRVLATGARYGLKELAAEMSDGCALEKTRDVQRRDANGRNVDLFNRVRWCAYDLVGTVTSQEQFSALILHLCELANDYAPPLPDSELRSTARSIAKWVWRRRNTIGRNRAAQRSRVLGLEPIRFEGELRQRAIEIHQAAGAEYARGCRSLKVKAAVAAAVDALKRGGARVTVAAIARRAVVSRPTVYRLLKERSEAESSTAVPAALQECLRLGNTRDQMAFDQPAPPSPAAF